MDSSLPGNLAPTLRADNNINNAKVALMARVANIRGVAVAEEAAVVDTEVVTSTTVRDTLNQVSSPSLKFLNYLS